MLRRSIILRIEHIEVIFPWLMRVSARGGFPIARLLHPESRPRIPGWGDVFVGGPSALVAEDTGLVTFFAQVRALQAARDLTHFLKTGITRQRASVAAAVFGGVVGLAVGMAYLGGAVAQSATLRAQANRMAGAYDSGFTDEALAAAVGGLDHSAIQIASNLRSRSDRSQVNVVRDASARPTPTPITTASSQREAATAIPVAAASKPGNQANSEGNPVRRRRTLFEATFMSIDYVGSEPAESTLTATPNRTPGRLPSPSTSIRTLIGELPTSCDIL